MSTQKDVQSTPLFWYVEYYGDERCTHIRCGHNNPEKAVQDFAFICFGSHALEKLECFRFFQSDGSVTRSGSNNQFSLQNRWNQSDWIYPDSTWKVQDFDPKTIRYVQYNGIRSIIDHIDCLAMPCDLDDPKAIMEIYQFMGGSNSELNECDECDDFGYPRTYSPHDPYRYAFFDRTIACVDGIIIEIGRSTITKWYFRSNTIVLNLDQVQTYLDTFPYDTSYDIMIDPDLALMDAFLRALVMIPPEHHVFMQFIVELTSGWDFSRTKEYVYEHIDHYSNEGVINIAVYASSNDIHNCTAGMRAFSPEDVVLPKLV